MGNEPRKDVKKRFWRMFWIIKGVVYAIILGLFIYFILRFRSLS